MAFGSLETGLVSENLMLEFGAYTLPPREIR